MILEVRHSVKEKERCLFVHSLKASKRRIAAAVRGLELMLTQGVPGTQANKSPKVVKVEADGEMN